MNGVAIIQIRRTCELIFPTILIQIPLLHSPFHVPIMAKLALATLLAATHPEKLAQYRLRVHAKGHLLRLHGLEECRLFLPTLLLIGLLLCPQLLLPLLGERFARLAGRRSLRLDLCDLLLHLGRFVFLFFFKGVSVRGVEDPVAKWWNAHSSSQRSAYVVGMWDRR